MALVPVGVTPLLKVHGCRQIDLDTTVWSVLQLGAQPIRNRIAGNAAWLSHRLANRDLLIVGYATDWDYLNQVLREVLGAVAPALVIIVNLSDGVALAAKAPQLVALGGRASLRFLHVSASADEFLDSLRRAFSRSFVRQVLHCGRLEFEDKKGAPPDPTWLEPPDLTSDAYWRYDAIWRAVVRGNLPRKTSQRQCPRSD